MFSKFAGAVMLMVLIFLAMVCLFAGKLIGAYVCLLVAAVIVVVYFLIGG